MESLLKGLVLSGGSRGEAKVLQGGGEGPNCHGGQKPLGKNYFSLTKTFNQGVYIIKMFFQFSFKLMWSMVLDLQRLAV